LVAARPGDGGSRRGGRAIGGKNPVVLAALLLLIPLIDIFFFPPEPKEGLVGISLGAGTFLVAAVVYVLISRNYNPSWLRFASSSYDVTQISCGLALFLVLNQPHTAVNSKVVFEGYFLGIGASSLRYDKRICITAGVLALAEYFAIVYYADTHWDLNNAIYSPYAYGLFSWSNEIARLIMMATASLLSLALVSRSQKLLLAATSDTLTGLFNRGYFEERFAIELSRSGRYGRALTLAVIDADRFKSLNDNHGHSAGDMVLRKIAELLRDSCRQSDTAARYGGEEFVVLLPETDIEAARQKVESLRELVASTVFALSRSRDDQNVQVTISAGLATFPQDGSDERELIAVADERMFQAKKEGRNRVIASSEPVLAER
jgi:two-component system cell cycle response regulator